MKNPQTLYPLGKNIFASVRTRKGEVKIHIRHYAVATNIKGGRAVPTQKGVSLGLKEFLRLLKIQKNLAKDYNQRMSSLFVLHQEETDAKSKTVRKRGGRRRSRISPRPKPSATMDNTTVYATDNYLQQIRQPPPTYSSATVNSLPVYCPATTTNLPVYYPATTTNLPGQQYSASEESNGQ